MAWKSAKLPAEMRPSYVLASTPRPAKPRCSVPPKRWPRKAGPPEQETHGGEGQALGGDGEDVLGPNQAAVEEEEPGDAHQQNQGGTDEDPGVVARGDGGGSDRNEHSAFL